MLYKLLYVKRLFFYSGGTVVYNMMIKSFILGLALFVVASEQSPHRERHHEIRAVNWTLKEFNQLLKLRPVT